MITAHIVEGLAITFDTCVGHFQWGTGYCGVLTAVETATELASVLRHKAMLWRIWMRHLAAAAAGSVVNCL